MDVEDEVSQVPPGDTCLQGCHLPKRYRLPCKCWLYRCVIEDIAIPLSLLHPRWLAKAPEIVLGWQMTFDSSITPASYAQLTGTDSARSQSDDQSDNDDDQGPASMSATRYNRRGQDLLEAGAFSAYEFHKKIPEAYRAEEYTREVTKAIQKVNKAYGQKYDEKASLPQSFTVAKKNDESLKYKKNGSRRRALTGRDAADQEDQALRRKTRADEIEKERNEKFAEQQRIDKGKEKETVSDFSQFVWPDERREPSSSTQQKDPEGGVGDGLGDFDEFFPNNDGDSDIEFLGTQPIQNPGQLPSEEGISPPSRLVSEPSLNDFAHIDDFDDFPPLSPGPLKKRAPPLMELPGRLSQQRRLVVPEEYDHDSTPSATTRAKRGVKKATSYKQDRWDSQLRHDAEAAADKAVKKEAAAARKKAKVMKPREEDVSQLADHLLSSSL